VIVLFNVLFNMPRGTSCVNNVFLSFFVLTVSCVVAFCYWQYGRIAYAGI